MAASDDFDLIVTGKSGHGAIPHETVDPVAIAAQIITAYHEIVSRKINPILPAVLSVCSVNTIQTHNVIPESIVLKGTVRCFDLQVRDQIRTEMQRVAAGICAAWGASFELDYVEGYPPVINEREMTALVQRAVKSIGAAQAVAVERPPMGGEDFAIFANQRPGAFFFRYHSPQGFIHLRAGYLLFYLFSVFTPWSLSQDPDARSHRHTAGWSGQS